MADGPAVQVQPFTPANPLTSATQAVNLGNMLQQNKLIQANTALTNTQNQQAQTNLTTGQTNRSFQITAGLLSLPDNQLAGGQPVRDALAAEHQAGNLNDQVYQTALSNLPPSTQSDGSPTPAAAYRQVLTAHLLAAHSPADELRAVAGQQTYYNTPGQPGIQNIQVPGIAAAAGTPVRNIGAPIATGLSPEGYAQRTPTIDPNSGQAGTSPLGTMPGSPGVAGPVQSPKVNIPSPNNPARLHPAQTAQNVPPPNTPSGFSPTALPPGSQPTIDASSQRLADDTTAMNAYPTRVQPLLQAIALAPNARSGPGSETINQVASFLQSRGSNVGITPGMDQSAAYDLLKKNLQKYTNALPQSGKSDAQLASAISGNPNASMSSLGLKDALVENLALERMQTALRKNYTGQMNGPAYQQYLDTQTARLDPRAFVANDQMTKDARMKMFKGMSPQDYENYKSSLEMARNSGVMTNTAFPSPQ